MMRPTRIPEAPRNASRHVRRDTVIHLEQAFEESLFRNDADHTGDDELDDRHNGFGPLAIIAETSPTIACVICLSSAQPCSVLDHELARELLHTGNDRTTDRHISECEAEVVALVVREAIGLYSMLASRDCAQLYSAKSAECLASHGRTQDAAMWFIAAVDGE